MIKFFRKIRRRLLSENKFTKYLLYAIGEIILVVIGILIALQINNWNESRKQREVLNNIYTTIKVDLEQDIKDIDKIVTTKEPLEKIYLGVIDKTIKKEDYKNCEDCWQINMGYSDIKLRKNGFELLSEYNKNHNSSKDSLAIQLKNLYNNLGHNIELSIVELKEDIGKYNESIVDKKKWFTDIVKGDYSEDFVDYALSDVSYRNTATLIHFVTYEKYIPNLKAYKKKGQELIDLINERVNK